MSLMDKERKKRLLHSLSATGAGAAAVPAAILATSPAMLMLSKGLTHAKPHITSESAYDFPLAAFGKDQRVHIAPGIAAQSSRRIDVPEVPPAGSRAVSLPVMAHESGHMHGGLVQKLTSLGEHGLFSQPGIGKYRLPMMVSPVHAGLAVAASLPKTEKNKVLRWLQSHPAAIAAGMSAIPLAGEAHASARAIRGIHKVYGSRAAAKSVVPLARAFGTHALGHAPAIAGLAVMGKVRDWLAKKRASKSLEKTGEAPGGGAIGRVVDRPLRTYNMPVQWSDFPWMNSEVNLMKPRRKQADPDRPEILHANTSTLLGAQE